MYGETMNKFFSIFQKYRVIFIIGFVIVVLVIPFFFFSQSKKNNQPPGYSPTLLATPTPVVIQNLSISSVSPANGASNVPFPPEVSVVFSRNLSSLEQSFVEISVVGVNGTTSWLDNKTAVFTPSQDLPIDQATYQAHVNYGSRSYSWSFTITIAQQPTVDPNRQSQSVLDDQWGKIQQQVQLDYPWMDSLPLSTDTYYVYFDASVKTFIVSVYPQSSSTPQDQQVAQIKLEVQSALKNLGVDTSKFTFEWDINPAP